MVDLESTQVDNTQYTFEYFLNETGYDYEEDFNHIDTNLDDVINERELAAFYEFIGKDYNDTRIQSIIS